LIVEVGPGETGPQPLGFELGVSHYTVLDVPDRWYGLDSTFFKVQTDDGGVYILRYSSPAGEWTLESFRRGDTEVGSAAS